MSTTVQVGSVADYVAAVIDFSHQTRHEVAFRGQRHDWPLHPRVVRDDVSGRPGELLSMPDCLRREFSTFGMFRVHGANLIPATIAMSDSPRAAWMTLMLMQHHRVPTRLLDWTQSALTALFFAIEHPAREGETPTVYGKVVETVYPVEELPRKGYEAPPKLFGQTYGEDDEDLFVIPPRVDRRMEAQAALFCLSLDPSTPVPVDIRWQLDPGARDAMLADLDRMGIHHFQQFPDLEGLGAWLGQADWAQDVEPPA